MGEEDSTSSTSRETATRYEFGPFQLDVRDEALLRDGRAIPLTHKAFETLRFLVLNRGRVLDKQQFMSAIWPDSFVEEATLAQNIFTLRRVLGEKPNEPRYIETVPRRGYRFVAEVSARVASDEPPLLAGPRTDAIKSIAILPFGMLNPDESSPYMGVALADALITKLSNIRKIIVRPTSSVLKFGSGHQDPISAGRELKVDLVLEGKVLVAADRVRVTVQLLNVATGVPLWAERFDEGFEDIFPLLDRTSEEVVHALTQSISSDERRLLARHYTMNAEAYQQYVRGRYQWNKWTEDGFLSSIRNFDRAIALDPNSALAFAGLADAQIALAYYGHWSPVRSMPDAKLAAERALEIDDALAEAHLSSASLSFLYDWNWARAELSFKRAIELNPSYATAHQAYGLYLIAMNRFDEAFDWIKHASELDPASLLINTTVGFPLYFARKFDRARAIYEKVLDLEPSFGPAHLALGDVYAQDSLADRAVEEYEQAFHLLGNNLSLASLGYAHARSGNRAAAIEIREKLRRMSGERYVSGVDIAAIHVALGEIDEAFECIERAYESRATRIVYLNVNPVFDAIRDDERFEIILTRINLTAARGPGSKPNRSQHEGNS